nr:hypothetical protein [Klebsiella pneumoniae]
MNYIKSLSGNTKGMALYGRVKEELIRRGVIAVYENSGLAIMKLRRL